MQFQNPPLIELVVELKWASAGISQALNGVPVGLPLPIPPSPDFERFHSRFVEFAAESGWSRSERLVPMGFPYLSFQPVMRIRSIEKERSSMLFQVGPGVFSVHAVRPYKNWDSFWPVIKQGIEILLRSRNEEDQATPFISTNVMYVDVFEESLIGEKPTRQFLEEVLGFGLLLPTVVENQATKKEEIEPQIALKIPLRSGLEMRLGFVGKAVWGDKKGIVMSTTVSNPRSVPPNMEEVTKVLDEAHLAIRTTFVGLTKKLHSAMVPMEQHS